MGKLFASRFLAALFLVGCGDGGSSVRPVEPAIPSPIARDSNAPFEERVRTIYNFKPTRLSAGDQNLKSAEMDALWSTVDRDPRAYLPRLRDELKKARQNAFFYYDGAQLLLKHSQSPEDLQLAADSIGRAEVEDVERMSYFRSTHSLAVKGANVWPCVDRILSEPAFQVFIPQHALKLDQTSVVIYCLLPMKEEFYVAPLASRLKGEENPVAVKSILAGLSRAVTEEGQAALRDFARNAPSASFRRLAEPLGRLPSKKDLAGGTEAKRELLFEFLKDLVGRRHDNPAYSFQEYRKQAPRLVRKEDLPKIRDLRRIHAGRVSDEAIDELEYLTLLMKVALGSED